MFYLVELARLAVIALLLVVFGVLTLGLVALLSPFDVSERTIATFGGAATIVGFWVVGLWILLRSQGR